MMRIFVFLVVLALVIPAAAGWVVAEDDPVAEKPKVDAEIQKLVDDLSSDDFNARERASHALTSKGEAARAALEWAAKHDESLEARWRAQQLLRRLEGQTAEPLDGPDRPELEDEAEADRIVRELQKRFFGERGTNPFSRGGLTLGTVKAPGLKLVPERLGRLRLEVTDETRTGPDAKTVYRGASLEAILAENPKLAEHPSMKELQAKAVDPIKQLEEMFKGGTVRIAPGQGFTSTMVVGSGVEIHQTPEQTTVKITEKDDDGNDVVKEYVGKDLDEIKTKHPEIADKLGSVGGIRFGFTPPQIFGGRNRPSPFERRTTTRNVGQVVLGVHVTTPQDALAVQLGLPVGESALVTSVEPGSQAETLGLKRHDIIVKVNTTPITSLAVLTRLFHAAASDQGPLTVDVIRRGQPVTLSR